jgi:hypothetical protein
MSRLKQFIQVGAIVGLLAAGAPVAASAATQTAGAVGPAAPAAVPNPPEMTFPGPGGQGPDSQQCSLYSHDLGPLGPMGPWGPHGPLHDKPHPACVGGGPDSK